MTDHTKTNKVIQMSFEPDDKKRVIDKAKTYGLGAGNYCKMLIMSKINEVEIPK